MDSIGQQPVLSTATTQRLASTHAPTAPTASKDVTQPPRLVMDTDTFTKNAGFDSLKTASLKETEAFLAKYREALPDLLFPSGIDRGQGALIIGVGNDLIRADINTLCALLAKGGDGNNSTFVRALLVFEAAWDAQLPDGAIQGIYTRYREQVDPKNGQPAKEPKAAMQDCFAHIAMASLVEAYIDHKDGLATDIRRIASFAQDAMSASETGSMMDALANATVRRELIVSQQEKLDDALNNFTDTMTTARFSGDYSQAFDRLQDFFNVAADVTETEHWRMRAADPTSACPPLTRGGLVMKDRRLLTAAMEFSKPDTPTLQVHRVKTRTTWEQIKTAFKSPFVALGRLVSGSAPTGTKGLVGVEAAKQLLWDMSSSATLGRLKEPPSPTWTQAEKNLQMAFASKAPDLVREAAKKGYLTELVRVATVAKEARIKPDDLIQLIGPKPTAERLKVIAVSLNLGVQRGIRELGKNGLGTLVQGVAANPLLMPAVEFFSKTQYTKDFGDLLKEAQKVEDAVKGGKKREEAIVDAARPKFLSRWAPADPGAYGLYKQHIKSLDDLDRITNTYIPSGVEGPARFALALTPGHERLDACKHIERLAACMEKHRYMGIKTQDFLDVLKEAPTGAVFDRFEKVLQLTRGLKTADGAEVDLDFKHALSLAKAFDDTAMPKLERLIQGYGQVQAKLEAKDIALMMTKVPDGVAFDYLLKELMPKMAELFPNRTAERASDLVTALDAKKLIPPNAAHVRQMVEMVRGQQDVTTDRLVALLDPSQTTVGIAKGTPYTSTHLNHVPTVWMPEVAADLTGFAPADALDSSNVSQTQWWRKQVGTDPDRFERVMVKIPPVDDFVDESFVPAQERMLSVLGNQMGLPVNLVQIVEAKDVAPQMGIEATGSKYASIHTPVGSSAKFLYEVMDQMGLAPEDSEYRCPPVNEACDEGRGASSWFRPDAARFMQKFKDGVPMMVMPDGGMAPPQNPLPPGAKLHTYRLENPEVLDQIVFFDKLIGNADRHGKNALLVPHEDKAKGITTYSVHLIDHGRAFFSGRNSDPNVQQDYIKDRLETLSAYLKSLTLPENATHLANIRTIMENFADLNDKQLLEDPIQGIPTDAFKSAAALKEQQDLLKAEQQLVRDFLMSLR